MLKKSSSKSSIFSSQKQSNKLSKIDPLQLSQQFKNAINQASLVLTHSQFSTTYEQMIMTIVKKAQIQNPHSQSVFLSAVKYCIQIYGGSLQLIVRSLLLEITSELNCNMLDEIMIKLDRAKHLVINTNVEYLLSKIFLLQQKYNILLNDESAALKSLKKCLELIEEHMIDYMQESQQIRKEIVDNTILAYYESYKLRKNQKQSLALDNLFKSYNAAKKNYGIQNQITKGLHILYTQQQSIINSIQKMSNKSRAFTQIIDYQNKKNYRTTAFYSWEDEKIVAQLIKTKGQEREVVSECCYEIKLDIGKIKQLRTSEWLNVTKTGQVVINEDELLNLLGVNPNSNNKQMTTRIQMRNVTRDEIIRKDNISSSSDDSQDFFQKQQFKFMKFGRAQSSKKFKDTQ